MEDIAEIWVVESSETRPTFGQI